MLPWTCSASDSLRQESFRLSCQVRLKLLNLPAKEEREKDKVCLVTPLCAACLGAHFEVCLAHFFRMYRLLLSYVALTSFVCIADFFRMYRLLLSYVSFTSFVCIAYFFRMYRTTLLLVTPLSACLAC